MSESEKLTFTDSQTELRKRWKAAHAAQAKQRAALLAQDVPEWDVHRRLAPVDWRLFAELTCGAKGKRTGKPCALTTIYANGRCKFHGGLSTGPTTAQGRAKSGRNGVGKAPVIDAATGLE